MQRVSASPDVTVRRSWRPRLADAIATALAVVTLWAAVAKAIDPEPLVKALLTYGLAAPENVDALSGAVIAAEIVVGSALMTRRHRRMALVGLAWLLVGFTLVLARAAARGLDVACGCFGATSVGFDGWSAVMRNVALIALTFTSLALSRAASVDPFLLLSRRFDRFEGACSEENP